MSPKKVAPIQWTMAPMARKISASKAASIGQTIVLHGRLEWHLSKTLFMLMNLPIEQGRVSFRLPPAKRYVQQIQLHLKHIGIGFPAFNFNSYGDLLDRAANARNALAHSVYLELPPGTLRIQLVSGHWDLGQDFERIPRNLKPETPVVDRAFLAKQRKAVNDALSAAEHLHAIVVAALRSLNERRRTLPELDRRLHSR